jgi:DNA-binding XRE family transcriptional regulator
MFEPFQPRSLRGWRQARKLTHDGIARVIGVSPDTLQEWERTGYPVHQDGPRKAILLAATFAVAPEAIYFGPNVRGFTVANCQFIIATNPGDDGDWEAFIAEWCTSRHGAEFVPGEVSERLNRGMGIHRSTATDSLVALEEEIRQLFRTAKTESTDSR